MRQIRLCVRIFDRARPSANAVLARRVPDSVGVPFGTGVPSSGPCGGPAAIGCVDSTVRCGGHTACREPESACPGDCRKIASGRGSRLSSSVRWPGGGCRRVTGLAFISANLGVVEIMGMSANGAEYGFPTFHYFRIGAVPARLFFGVVMMPFYYGSKVRSVRWRPTPSPRPGAPPSSAPIPRCSFR